ncbi:RNA-binding cell elongation regulator Jag/EloR [Thermoflexus sp.]|uniref:RNA-binding cell elongation regulator Jag/EloR n=1 Tax=Thermoflexus sp. TaxID=1969742 RepID=UPI0025DE7648|nr:RNA-binding cell elongation regulator Jag/EloR [Thermoflexus sp.]MCS6963988.1 protein jag [Thermoflexus sp.]MCX7690138.1 protein jag [Thermoflexus sp.]MDW8183915.1 RNA-binding cell elongation regulator Jag/EloR [Anaerolineae bacterium]
MELVVSGSTIEAAIQAGLAQLGVPREAVEIEVLDPGSPGFLGIGAREARVRLVVRELVAPSASGLAPEQIEEAVAQAVSGLLTSLGIQATLSIAQETVEGPEERGNYSIWTVRIEGPTAGRLIGRHGRALYAFQTLARAIVARRLGTFIPLVVDINGYRAKRAEALRRLALKKAEQVMATGRPVELEPMPAAERRVIHMTLKDHPKVTTYSIGEGEERRVVIAMRWTSEGD